MEPFNIMKSLNTIEREYILSIYNVTMCPGTHTVREHAASDFFIPDKLYCKKNQIQYS